MTWVQRGTEIRDATTGTLVATVHAGERAAREIVACHNAVLNAREDLVLARAGLAESDADHEALAEDVRAARAFLRRLGP